MIDTQVFAEHRRLLFDVAYRMTGSVADAEDIVQEAWLRSRDVDGEQIANPRAYLVKTITNLSLNQLTSARARRETYVGPWLPEPILTAPDAGQEAEMADSVSMAMLVVLETLSPAERAVFLLHDVFGYNHGEIAAILDKSEVAVRQTAARARAHVAARRPRFDVDQGVRDQAVDRFRQACVGGDLNAMMELLAPDVVCWSDGGGKVTAARRPLEGADSVARWLIGVFAKPESQDATMELTQINGELGILGRVAGQPVGVVCFDFADGRITGVRMQVNPDKLGGLTR
ncbi:MAG: RNA polymerase sigma-70 factor [Hamadaea sp.]|uniref:RNA polymerase sigma-70 factor n=1 Tax=Hamadaea sp. TaxID=2024425 RepID=UPI0017DE07CF|nr:RNA polymerase sigma-70 factor [Hamadaea sp.]NUR72578.1 RNA polymerase sigma-70 factor [Hamadaea sp.]NUT22213.1 RNA polymerase sigma-70 factor [Hamadaea sp.]